MPCVVLRGLGVLLPRTRSFRRFRRFRPPAVVVQRRTSARPTLRANASLLDHSTISLAVHACVGTALLATLGISLLTSRDDTRLATASSPPEDTFETSVRWSVMTVLSFFPYFNFASWAFAAIDAGGLMAVNSDRDTNDQSYFWLLSILYFVPYIVDGFQLDTFTLFTIALGALHVQIERLRYYDGAVMLPTFDILGQPGIPELNVRPGAKDTEDANGVPCDDLGEARLEQDQEEVMFQELVQNELSDFDRRLGIDVKAPDEG